MDRREALRLLAAAPVAAGVAWTTGEAAAARRQADAAIEAARQASAAFQPAFFTPHEHATVRLLVDLIIPRDERSGAATDAGVPEFMDFMVVDQPERQTAMRGGLAWLDRECERRFDRRFIDCTDENRRLVLDAIAWPERAAPELSQGAAFFTLFRDLTAAGYWTSRMGIEDLRYQGNVFVAEWTGCPDAALSRLGVRYDDRVP